METIKLKKETQRCIAILAEVDKLGREFEEKLRKLAETEDDDCGQSHLAGVLMYAVYSPIGVGTSATFGATCLIEGVSSGLSKKKEPVSGLFGELFGGGK